MKTLLDQLFPDSRAVDTETLEAKGRHRGLAEGQMVTRIAPSPTGFVHIGTIYMGLINDTLAKQSGGRSMMRIEDTDQKRQIENGVNMIISAFKTFGISFDEGPQQDGSEKGEHGPYIQSKRKHIYQAYARKLLLEGKAYPCFCTPEDLDRVREEQTLRKERTGYYGAYAKCRHLPQEEVEAKLAAGTPFVVRMKSRGSHEKRRDVHDLVRGTRSVPENDIDPIIMKSDDGLPTYHFAHVIDDHLMGTTHVIRGDEWFPSLPLHLEMFETMGWQPPLYAHLSPIQKMEGNAKRKLSKRKDPEANIEYFFEQGYPVDAIAEYLLNLANSDFEDWRMKNPALPLSEFKLELQKTSPSGALFDIVKLNSISKRVISEYDKDRVFDLARDWAERHDPEFYDRMNREHAYFKAILNIERETERKRKDIVRWGTLKDDVAYFFEDLFVPAAPDSYGFDAATVTKVLNAYLGIIDTPGGREAWWEKVRETSDACGFTPDMKAYKANKAAFSGSVADFMKIVRLSITGRADSPDVYEISYVMGLEKAKARINDQIAALQGKRAAG